MTFKPRIWEPIAWLLSGINLVSVWFAAVPGETWHATTHALLAAAFALWAQNLRRRNRQLTGDSSTADRLDELEARVDELDALPNVAPRLAELEERLDFAERAMVEVRKRAQLPPQA